MFFYSIAGKDKVQYYKNFEIYLFVEHLTLRPRSESLFLQTKIDKRLRIYEKKKKKKLK